MRWGVGNEEIWVTDSKFRINWDKKAPSKGSQIVKNFLKDNFKSHILYEEYRLPRVRLKVDFLSATGRWAIEFHGVQHSKYIKHFHKNPIGFLNSLKRDTDKYEMLEKAGFKVVELYDEDLENLTIDFFNKKLKAD